MKQRCFGQESKNQNQRNEYEQEIKESREPNHDEGMLTRKIESGEGWVFGWVEINLMKPKKETVEMENNSGKGMRVGVDLTGGIWRRLKPAY